MVAFDGARDQRERLVAPATERVRGREGRGDIRHEGELPRPAQVEGLFEHASRAWEFSATEEDNSQARQSSGQRERMIDRFGDAYGGLGVRESLIEPAELGEYLGEVGPRERRLDGRRAEALIAEVALQRDVPLEKGDRLAEFTSAGVRHAQERRGDHLDRAIAKGLGNAKRLLAESDGLGALTSPEALDHHEGCDPGKPALVAERPGQHLRLVEVLPHVN